MPRIYVIVGHYGTGKSEAAISLAVKRREEGHQVTLGDLDIVNVYFRSREKAEFLEEMGIEVVSSILGHHSSLDLGHQRTDSPFLFDGVPLSFWMSAVIKPGRTLVMSSRIS